MHRLLSLAFLGCLLLVPGVSGWSGEKKGKTVVPEVLRFKMKNIDGKEVDLASYQGKVLLLVNVASACGLTPQYEGLQALHKKFGPEGLVVLGFPCNDFGAQEPGNEAEIKKFCTGRFGVTFDMFAKIRVKGDQAAPLFRHLTSKVTNPRHGGPITWNFEKFLIGRDGTVAARFAPEVEPLDEAIVAAVRRELGKKN